MKKVSSRELLSICWYLTIVAFMFIISACNQSEPPPPQQQSQAPVAGAPQPQQMPTQSSGQAPVSQATAPQGNNSQLGPVSGPASTPPLAQAISQIRMGMTSQEIIAILGQPGRIEPEDGGSELEYYTPQGKFEIKLQNDRVVSFKSK